MRLLYPPFAGGTARVRTAVPVAATAVALLTLAFVQLGVTNPTIVALSFLLVVLVVATFSPRRVAVGTSLLSFACFNFFFLPPVRTFTIADPQHGVALLTLLAVSIVASHLASQARERAHEVLVERTRLLEERKEAEVVRRGAELKSALLASLSHDFKTPLTAVTVAANNLNATWLTRHRVHRGEIEIRLTPKEFELLTLLVSHAGRVMTHRSILKTIWGSQASHQPEHLRVLIGQLRKKIEPDPANPRYLLTEPWVGYRFAEEPE